MLTLDHSQDYKVWANRETVTLTQVDLGGNTTTMGIDAKRRPVSVKEAAASFGVYTQQDTNFYLPVSLVTGTVKPRDTITDANSVVYTVLEAPKFNLGAIWKCVSRDLVLVNGLRDTISFRRPMNLQDASANREPVYAVLAEGVAARVQETGRQVKEALGKRITEITYSVWIDRQLALTHEDQLLWILPADAAEAAAGEAAAEEEEEGSSTTPAPEPRVLEIVGGQDAENIGALQRVDAIWRGF